MAGCWHICSFLCFLPWKQRHMMPGLGRLAAPKHQLKNKWDVYQFQLSLCGPAHHFLLAPSLCVCVCCMFNVDNHLKWILCKYTAATGWLSDNYNEIWDMSNNQSWNLLNFADVQVIYLNFIGNYSFIYHPPNPSRQNQQQCNSGCPTQTFGFQPFSSDAHPHLYLRINVFMSTEFKVDATLQWFFRLKCQCLVKSEFALLPHSELWM